MLCSTFNCVYLSHDKTYQCCYVNLWNHFIIIIIIIFIIETMIGERDIVHNFHWKIQLNCVFFSKMQTPIKATVIRFKQQCELFSFVLMIRIFYEQICGPSICTMIHLQRYHNVCMRWQQALGIKVNQQSDSHLKSAKKHLHKTWTISDVVFRWVYPFIEPILLLQQSVSFDA